MKSIEFSKTAGKEFLDFKNNDKIIFKKINILIDKLKEHPFIGTGKPEPLTGNYSGYWSRRITKKHRLIYKVKNDKIIIVQCKFHYDD